MDEFLILLQAKLDEAKSKGNINTDIDKLQDQLDKLKLQATLDPKSAQNLANEIGKLVNQKIVISNIGVDTSGLNKSGQKAADDFSNGVSQGLKKSSNILSSFKKSLENMGMESNEIDSIATKINNLGVQIESLSQTRTSGKKDILSVDIAGIDEYGQAIKLTQQYDIATGELIKNIDAVSTAQEKVGISTNSIKKAENVFVDYTAKISQFKSTNSNILSGLTEPLSDFENKLAGLKNGTSTVDDVVNSYKNLNTEASKITANLSAQFNKVDSAVRNIAKGSETIASLKADFKGLSNAPKEVNTELSKCEKLLQNVKNIESQEGLTVNWSAAYKEWEKSVDNLTAKLKVLKKEQANSASTQILNTEDLDRQEKLYVLKVRNTITKIKSELESKLRNSGYSDIEIKGVEETTGKVKSLTATVTDATGAFKRLNFERTKVQKDGKAQDGFVQSDDVKVLGDVSKSVGKVQENLTSLKSEWEEQGILVGEFRSKVETLETSLGSVGSKGELENLKTQIKSLKNEAATIDQVNEIQLSIGDKGDITAQIKVLYDNFTKLGFSADEVKTKMSGVDIELSELKTLLNSGASDSAITTQFNKLQLSLKETQNDFKTIRSEYSLLVSAQQRLNKANEIETWNQKNSKATNQVRSANEAYIASLRDLNSQMTKMQFNEIVNGFKQSEISMRSINKLGASLKDQMTQAAQSFTQWLSVSSAVMLLISKSKNAISELKEVNTLLTEISKANDKLSKSDLEKIGNDSFDVASKYGKTATDYLSGVQEASRAGYENAMGIAELSVAAQGAGDMTAELANQYIIATDKAYKFGGSVEKLTEVLDGSNYITNHNAVNMTELAEGMSIVGSQAASLGVDVDETTAVLGTMIATTQQSGSEMARAFKAILLNLQQVTDEEEGIDAEGLTKYEEACKALNVSLKETKNGITSLRDPMEVLKDLAEEYSKLDSNDIRRTNLLSSVGGKLRANALNAILENYDMYEKMLREYAQGTGSMAAEAEKTANSWEGSLNRLSNTWTDTVENIANSDSIITIINGLNGLLSVINNVTDKLGSLGTIGLGAGITAFVKNFA